MKNGIRVGIALLAFLVGVIGLVVCLVPHYSAPDKIIARYVAAINDGNVEKMNKCMLSGSEEFSNLLGKEMGDIDDLLGSLSSSEEAAPGNAAYVALQSSTFSAGNRLPDDVTEVKAVELYGCTDGETQTMMGITGLSVDVILKVTYVDGEGAEQTLFSEEDLNLIKSKSHYMIVG